jgi:hypothetical protein
VGVVDGTGRAGSRDIEASCFVPLAGQAEEHSVDTCMADYIPFGGDRCDEVGHMMLGEVHRVTRKRKKEKSLESCENFLRY